MNLNLLIILSIIGFAYAQQFPWGKQNPGGEIAWPANGWPPKQQGPWGALMAPTAPTRPPRPQRPPRPTTNPCPWGSFGCDPNQPQQPPTPPRGTTTAPSTTTALSDCQMNCQATQEFNPLCGSDGSNYRNPSVLKCAQMCGKDVRMQYSGTCRRRS